MHEGAFRIHHCQIVQLSHRFTTVYKTVEINHSDSVETTNRSYESKLEDAPGVQIVNRLICDNHIR